MPVVMRSEDLGINVKTGEHSKVPLTPVENAFVGIIWVDHVGRDHAIPAVDFAEKFRARLHIAENIERCKRMIRQVQNHLIIRHDLPVYSAAGYHGGYYIGEETDAGTFYEAFRGRGLTGLTKASRGRRSGMIDTVTQLSFHWRDLVRKAGLEAPAGEDQSIEAPIAVVDAFLKKMLDNPEKFSDGLRMLREKYGGVLIPKPRYDQIIAGLKTKSAELSALASALEN